MEQDQQQFTSEMTRLQQIVQTNNSIQDDVSANIKGVEEELIRVDNNMKEMKRDSLQYRYALDGMTKYNKERKTVRDSSISFKS